MSSRLLTELTEGIWGLQTSSSVHHLQCMMEPLFLFNNLEDSRVAVTLSYLRYRENCDNSKFESTEAIGADAAFLVVVQPLLVFFWRQGKYGAVIEAVIAGVDLVVE